MGKSSGELDDLCSLASLIRWMNSRPRRPGEDHTEWRHENARAQLELLGLRFIQRGKGCMLFFRKVDLQEVAPLIARAFLSPPEPGAEAEA